MMGMKEDGWGSWCMRALEVLGGDMDKAGQMGSAVHTEPTTSQQKRGSGGIALTLLEVEVIGRFCRPQPHGVYSVVLVSWHWRVVRHSKDNLQKDRIPL